MILRAILVTGLVLAVVLVARWWRERDGRVRPVGETTDAAVASAVLVSTPTCRTCPEVRAVLADVAAAGGHFTWDEVDAATDLDFVRHHRVLRAPTVLFRDATGAVVARAAGSISRQQVLTTLGRPARV